MKRIIAIVVVVTVLSIGVVGVFANSFMATSVAPMGGAAPSYYGGGGYATNNRVVDFAPAKSVDSPAGLNYDAVTSETDGYAAPEQAQQPDRMVIKNADLSIVVKDPKVKMDEIIALATSLGGYVVSSSSNQSYLPDGTKVPEGYVTLRVPQEKLAQALESIKANVVEVQTDTISGQDVTKEYTDLSSQLKNLQATEKKLTEIMDKAEKTEDVLAVFTQLTQIRGQIEVIVGQMKYYEQSVALSAISVHIVAQEATQPIKIAGWEPQGQARNAAQALVNFFQGFVNFLIWFAIFLLPVLLVLLLVGFVLWRLGKWVWRRFIARK